MIIHVALGLCMNNALFTLPNLAFRRARVMFYACKRKGLVSLVCIANMSSVDFISMSVYDCIV